MTLTAAILAAAAGLIGGEAWRLVSENVLLGLGLVVLLLLINTIGVEWDILRRADKGDVHKCNEALEAQRTLILALQGRMEVLESERRDRDIEIQELKTKVLILANDNERLRGLLEDALRRQAH